MNNLQEYADAVIYDSENARFQAEVERALHFYLELCQQASGPVLELGCGTGRYTIPIAQEGVAITGLDVASAMLRRAREKSNGVPVRWVEADARSFHLDERFALIFESGAMFRHLLERADHEAALACVREHLLSNGRFVVATSFPRPDMLQDSPEEQEWFEHTDELGRHVRVSGAYSYDPVRQVAHENAIRRWTNEAGEEFTTFAPLALRLFFPQELDALLHYNGFRIVEQFGDWDRSALTKDSPMIICVCQLR
jgi:SAM-dependent methyltransferase